MSVASVATLETVYDANELIDLLTRQRDFCRTLQTLLQRQRTAITTDDSRRLLDVLEQRRRILEAMNVVSIGLRVYQADWTRVREQLVESDRGLVDKLATEVNELLANILKTDEEDAKLLAARKSIISQEMSGVKTGRQAGTAYATSGSDRPTQMEWTDA